MSEERARRHCMVVHAYYPVGETRVQREALALVDRGHTVDVVCLRDRGEAPAALHDGVRVRRLPVRRHRNRGMAVQMLEYLAFFVLAAAVVTARHVRRPYAAVQVHNLPDFLVFCALVPRLLGAAVILDLHDLMPEFFASRTGSGTDHPLVRLVAWQERLACRFADRVVTVTDVWRDTLIGRGVPPEKVAVVMNVADSRLFHHNGQGPDDGERPGDGLRLLYHGTFTHRYGVDLLLDALALLRDDLPDVHLTLLGDGDLRPDLLAQRSRLGLERQVTISDGMVDAAGLPAAIRSADVGVVPTRSDVFTDGLLPTKLMELVAVGTPVLAARTPTVSSYFDDDMVAFFEPGDAADLARSIRALAADPGLGRTLARNADAFNRTYDYVTVAASYAAVVDAAIRERTRAGRTAPARAAGATPPTANGDTPGPAPTATGTVPTTAARTATAHARTTVRAAPDRAAPTTEVTVSTAAHDREWDVFLAGLPTGHHTQTSLWAQVKAVLGWQAARVIARRDGVVVAGAQILYRRVSAAGAVGYVSRAPVVAGDDPALVALVLDEVERTARDLHIRHLTVQPHGTDESVPRYLASRGYLDTSTEVAPRATAILDVSRKPEQILAAMSAKTRYNVRLGGRRSVVVREGDAADVATYHRLLEATGQRQGFTAQPRAYFETMWRVLAPPGHLRLALAEVDGEAVAAQLAVAFGDTVVNKLSVWSGREGNRRPNEALQWSTIQWAHQHGYRSYDLEGLKLKAARAVARGEPLPPSAAQSVTSYKLGFGGTVVLMPPARVYIPNPALRWGFAYAYPRVAGLRTVKTAVKRMRTGAGQGG